MPKVFENKWSPVSLRRDKKGKPQTPYTITSQSVSSSWYNRMVENGGSRYNRLLQIHEADIKSVEISRALDVIAEDISSCNADNQEFFVIDYPDDENIKKTLIKNVEKMKTIWEKRTKFDAELFNRVRKTIKKGITFYRKMPDGTLKELPTERMTGYILSPNDESQVTHYLYEASLTRIEDIGRVTRKTISAQTAGSKQDKYEVIPVDDMLIMKVGEGPFGESLVDKVYKVWKQIDMLEQAILIYRIVRAPEKRVYYIDTGALQGAKRDQAINQQRLRLMQKRAQTKTGDIENEYDVNSTTEDIFIPTNSTGKGSRIETLPAGQNLGELTDLNHFLDKMTKGLRIPTSMIDPQAESQQQFSDMRVGQTYQVEMRYLGHVKRLKRQLEPSLFAHFKEFCVDRGLMLHASTIFRINDSMSFAVYKEIEVNQSLLNVFNSTLQIQSLSKKVALQKYMNMDQEDIKHNEHQKLLEKGLTGDQIKEMPQEAIDNIVYGDGRLGKDYGIEPAEGSGGYGY